MIEYTDEQHDSLIRGHRKQLADAQATVEALQAVIRQMGEQAAVLAKDGMAAKAQVAALQRERDDAVLIRDHNLRMCEALDSKYKKVLADLDAEREKVAERNEFIADCDMTLDRIQAPRTNDGQEELVSTWRRIELIGGLLQQYRVQLEEHVRTQSQLSQLQALVRALPVVRIDLNGAYHDTLLARPEEDAVKELLRYRASLDATTPDSNQLGDINDMVSKGGDGE